MTGTEWGVGVGAQTTPVAHHEEAQSTTLLCHLLFEARANHVVVVVKCMTGRWLGQQRIASHFRYGVVCVAVFGGRARVVRIGVENGVVERVRPPGETVTCVGCWRIGYRYRRTSPEQFCWPFSVRGGGGDSLSQLRWTGCDVLRRAHTKAVPNTVDRTLSREGSMELLGPSLLPRCSPFLLLSRGTNGSS
jgi:hypothetical protein